MKRSFSLVMVCAALLGGCSDDGGDDGSAGSSGSSGSAGSAGSSAAPTLSKVQSEVLDKSCAFSSCHGGPTSPNLTAGKTYASVVGKASNLEAGKTLVVAGKPDESMLYLLLKGGVGNVSQMPQGQTLAADKVELVRAWIEAGAKDD